MHKAFNPKCLATGPRDTDVGPIAIIFCPPILPLAVIPDVIFDFPREIGVFYKMWSVLE